ncbi:MAG TPA: bacillithiol biosynthesis deacetylase BshB1 [Candidatus Limnocylindria bacterium]|nr:bacillithiol biosynthesis deacetylase BshB1 [Candidatus Limnocylindria bacterium]
MPLDALFFGAHPDDIELTSGGLAALLACHGHAVGLVDLTRGEKASRGTVEERGRETQAAAKILGVQTRLNLALPDLGLDRHDLKQQQAIVTCLREHRPRLVVAPDPDDAHPDHIEAGHLVSRACYLAGLLRFAATGRFERHRPERLLFALYRGTRRPHLIVDVSQVWERRMDALRQHQSQLDPASGPATYLTEPDFLDEIQARARVLGATIGVRYGEGYRSRGPLGIQDARVLLTGAHTEVAT